MSEAESLEDIRARIAAEEAQAESEKPQATEAEEVEELDEEVEPEAEETEPETEEGEAETEEDVPEFAKSESDKKDLVPLAKHLDVKFKLRGEVSERDAKIAELEQKLAQVQAAPPRLVEDLEIAKEAWEFDGTTEEFQRYKAQIDARNAIKLQRSELQRQALEKRQREESARVDAELDKHYDRAANLIAGGVIKDIDSFKNAESVVVRSLDRLDPGAGKYIVDTMISRLGEGSEKVIYHLGRNPTSLQELEQKLREDPSGISAAMYVAEKKALFLSKPINKPKPAPKPDVPLQGKAPKVSNHKAAYLKAEKSGDYEAASAARKAARAAGENPNNW